MAYVPVSVVKDDFKYWEYIWPRLAVMFDPVWSNNPDCKLEEKYAQEYAFLCHHHDKCIQYRDLWEEKGAPWRWAVMLYMLSFSQYKGDRCDVGEWVGQYTREVIEDIRTLPLFERALERQFLQDDLKSYEVKLLEIASAWVRGKTPTVHTSSTVHTGHSILEKMQLATRIARTLKCVSVMHCWRNYHGELNPSDSDFVTKFTFPKWDAE